MDDLTISETLHIVNNLCSSNLQQSSNDICEFVHEKKMMLNPVKCKEMFVCFKRVPPVIDNITINNVPIERVSTYKLFGVNLSSNLKWNEHVNMITNLRCSDTDLVTFYSTCVRTILEYACPAWFYSTTEYLREQIESIQRRIMRIIFPETP